MSSASGRVFNFEQRGGRLKLVEGNEISSVTPPAATSRSQLAKGQLAEPSWSARDHEDLLSYLEVHHFKDVNEAKYSYFGFRWFHPLHKAVKDQDFRHVELLLKFGANLWAKDSCGKNALHYASSDAMRWKIIRLRESIHASGLSRP